MHKKFLCKFVFIVGITLINLIPFPTEAMDIEEMDAEEADIQNHLAAMCRHHFDEKSNAHPDYIYDYMKPVDGGARVKMLIETKWIKDKPTIKGRLKKLRKCINPDSSDAESSNSSDADSNNSEGLDLEDFIALYPSCERCETRLIATVAILAQTKKNARDRYSMFENAWEETFGFGPEGAANTGPISSYDIDDLEQEVKECEEDEAFRKELDLDSELNCSDILPMLCQIL